MRREDLIREMIDVEMSSVETPGDDESEDIEDLDTAEKLIGAMRDQLDALDHLMNDVEDHEEDEAEAIAPGDDGDRLPGRGRQHGRTHDGAPTFSSYCFSRVFGSSGSGTP